MPPRPARHLIELLPIAFVPSRHFLRNTFCSTHWMPRGSGRFVSCSCLPVDSLGGSNSALFIYFLISSAKHFPCLLYQTRYEHICFGQHFQAAGGNPCQKTCAFGSSLAIPAEVNTHL